MPGFDAFDSLRRQFEEFDRLTKPIRDLEAQFAQWKPVLNIDALLKPTRDSEALAKPLRDIESAMKSFHTSPVQESIRRSLDIGGQVRKALDDRLGCCTQAIQETICRMEEMTTGVNIRLPEIPMPGLSVPIDFPNPIPGPSEPEPTPKRRPVFIETDDL